MAFKHCPGYILGPECDLALFLYPICGPRLPLFPIGRSSSVRLARLSTGQSYSFHQWHWNHHGGHFAPGAIKLGHGNCTNAVLSNLTKSLTRQDISEKIGELKKYLEEQMMKTIPFKIPKRRSSALSSNRRRNWNYLLARMSKPPKPNPSQSNVIPIGYRAGLRKPEFLHLDGSDPPVGWIGTWTRQQPYLPLSESPPKN